MDVRYLPGRPFVKLRAGSEQVLEGRSVIPGRLAIARATGIQGKEKLLDTRFRGYDANGSFTYFADSVGTLGRTLANRQRQAFGAAAGFEKFAERRLEDREAKRVKLFANPRAAFIYHDRAV